MRRLKALAQEKQAAFRQRMNGRRVPLITLKGTEGDRARGTTPALSDHFLPVEIAGEFPANRMLWAAVSHRKASESHPNGREPVFGRLIYSSSEGAPSTTLEESHSTR
jgi:hypothetical protein